MNGLLINHMQESKYQQNIVETVLESKNGIYKISALAGSGKTTTAKDILQKLPIETKWLVLVFNTDNKDDWRKWSRKQCKDSQGEIHSFASFVMKVVPGNQWDWVKKNN